MMATARPAGEPQRLLHHQEVGQHDERGVAVPALPTTALVVAQAEELLAAPEVLLDRPATPVGLGLLPRGRDTGST